MRKISLSLTFCLVTPFLFAQRVISTQKNLVWSDSLKKIEFSDYRLHSTFYFQGAAFNESLFEFLPYFFESVKLPIDGSFSISISDEVYQPLSTQRRIPGEVSFAKIQNSPVIITGKGYEKGKAVAQISILPFRKNAVTNEVEKLVSFRYQISITASEPVASLREGEYAAHSVLAAGTWYKIGVTKEGVQKIDKSFLENLGINVSAMDPRNIRVYGNGGGMLPEANSIFRYDDLQENPIQVFGEEDGKFDDGDYVLFYGQSADEWKLDTAAKKFYHINHIYSDTIFYFINADLGSGKRISSQSSSAQTANKHISVFDDYASHEVDEENFLHSGRVWYGEAFEFEPLQSFPFSFPSLITSAPVKVTTLFLAKSIYGSNTVTVSSGGQTISSLSIAKVCADYTCPFGTEGSLSGQFNASSSSFSIDVELIRLQQDAQGWLNYIEVNAQRNLTWTGSQFNFRSIASRGTGSISQFTVSNTNSLLMVWDVSNPVNPIIQNGTISGNQFQFNIATDTLKEFVMFALNEGHVPSPVGVVHNQDLHSLGAYDMFIVTPDFLFPHALDLANFHISHDGYSTKVVTQSEIFNEFSSGTPDASAIRDFVRMFYKRAAGDTAFMPKYLLLFGDGSVDNKGIVPSQKSLILTYQSPKSTSPVDSYVSDDFFAFLDNSEGGNLLDANAKLDVAIGRLTVNDVTEAADVINKIKIYCSPQSFGNWRNVLTFVADDQDNNVHVNDCDEIATEVSGAYPVYNIDKIYLDAYQQVSVPGGTRYPEVNTAITNRVCSGTLLMNYIGHGGVGGWAHERILGIEEIQAYTNLYKLPVFLTATCEFTEYDNPAIVSAGEELLLNPNGGAIALVTTVRLVYSSANKLMNEAFMNNVFKADEDGTIPPLGEILRRAKNSITGDVNNRKFTLVGDPAITMAYPKFNVKTTAINGQMTGGIPDTLKALEKVTVSGTVNDLDGVIMSDFNGTLYPTVYDKAVVYQTLKNDPDSYVKNLVLQKNVIYNGKASVKNGEFTFSFIVPKDISYQYGYGKLSYNADNGMVDANGYKNDIVIGGISDSSIVDLVGPSVTVYMNDDKFVSGGITDRNPTVLVKISDSSGVNTVGTGIGHDIAGVLDNDTKNTLVMNDFYSADLDSYSSGEARYPLSDLSEGQHTISVKAWDVYNNSAEGSTEFIVSSSATMALEHVFNYPNPFTTRTEFMFEHNMPGQLLDVMIQIYTVSGKLIKSMHETVMPEMFTTSNSCCLINGTAGGYRVNGIFWDGRDDYGDLIGKGVYVYKLTVKAENGMNADTFQKLVILK